MISYIKGVLTEKAEGYIVVETSGIGFEIRVNSDTVSRLPGVDSEVKVLTHLQVTENERVL